MKKIITFLLSLTSLVALCAFVSIYVIDLRLATQKKPQRYKLIFGKIVRNTGTSHSTEQGLVRENSTLVEVLFKFDTATGQAWRYVDDFYYDPNQTITTKGFQLASEDFGVYNYASRGKASDTSTVTAEQARTELKRRGVRLSDIED